MTDRKSDIYNGKGYALGNLNKYREAIECFDKAIEINPKHADAWRYKGYALSKLEDEEKLILSCFNKALELTEEEKGAKGINYAYALNSKGYYLLNSLRKDEDTRDQDFENRCKEAIDCFDSAIQNISHLELRDLKLFPHPWTTKVTHFFALESMMKQIDTLIRLKK